MREIRKGMCSSDRAVALVVASLAVASLGATHRTKNFVAEAPSREVARAVADAAERYRKEIAKQWLDYELPNWSGPCLVIVQIDEPPANGETAYIIDRGEVYGWRMRLRGPVERIIESVLPHEVGHTVFASHFRFALPRWADEGAASLCEGEQDRVRRQLNVAGIIRNRPIPLRALIRFSEYPADIHAIRMVYAQGYLLTSFLVERDSKLSFIRFLRFADKHGWDAAVKRVYGFDDVEKLDEALREWLQADGRVVSRAIEPRPGEQNVQAATGNIGEDTELSRAIGVVSSQSAK